MATKVTVALLGYVQGDGIRIVDPADPIALPCWRVSFQTINPGHAIFTVITNKDWYFNDKATVRLYHVPGLFKTLAASAIDEYMRGMASA
jgi:hypothetical protein